MEYERYSKKELAALIRELKEKLTEMKQVEKHVEASAEELPLPAVGLHKDDKGAFYLVELRFDAISGAAVVSNKLDLNSKDPSIASYKLKEYVIEKVFRKSLGGKYNE
jgi:hypothetical protein